MGHLCAYLTSAEKSEPAYYPRSSSAIAQEVVSLLESKIPPFVSNWFTSSFPSQWYASWENTPWETRPAIDADAAVPTSHVLYGALILVATIKAHTVEFYQRYSLPARCAIATRYKRFSPLVLRSR
ncbi:hypothetical protein GNI_054520 [Gregarina niphandrodes]|uniref:Uncharacterized protein n=1 Tax=Gregarina niphandrodes TaxID=110365 RepID=A0A023B916_GRENI|nr:hypothetical protein GNI_054520 [Gregarina niphandrodes]EZG70699.1 hypothetical protein GNI_054520 [Gregarina niphandrodes]|eukprot:XP_011129882.1 hypothetical protein GNI_054520 [Gregarina niphandrodes]